MMLHLTCLILLLPLAVSMRQAKVADPVDDFRFVLQDIGRRLAGALPRQRLVRVAVMPFAEVSTWGSVRQRPDLSDELARLLERATNHDPQLEIVPSQDVDRAARELGLGHRLGASVAPLVGVSLYADCVVVGTLTASTPGVPGDVTAELIEVRRRRRLAVATVELIAPAVKPVPMLGSKRAQ